IKFIAPIFADPNSPSTAALSAVWTACRIDDAEARSAIRQALTHNDETVRQAAIHAVSIWRDEAAVPPLVALLESPLAPNQRAAAEALGRIGDPTATAALLKALPGAAGDRARAPSRHSAR